MIKYLFILINSISLFVLGLFSGGDGIKLSGNLPQTVSAGQEFTIEFKINKTELNGFGRLLVELPEGFNIKNAEDKGAEYTFEENKAKWVWAALPADKEITLKVTLIAAEAAIGEKVVNAKFSYVENNEKQFTDMDPATINVTAAVAKTEPATPVVKAPDSLTVATPTVSNAEPPGKIVVERSTKKSDKDMEFLVTIKIKKGVTKGFARYSDDAHENLSAKPVKTDGSSFSIADGKIKFVWVNVPEKEDLEVSYTLSGSPGKHITLNGEYSYLEDNQSKKVELKAEMLDFTGQAPKEEKKEEVATTPVKETETTNLEKTTDSSTSKPVSTVEKKEGKADFKVQIGAFTNANVSALTLKQKFNINETISSESNAGFAKFMIGSHTEYKKARAHKQTTINVNGVKSAFVVAYNEGKRITVQEALMITNQRWFP